MNLHKLEIALKVIEMQSISKASEAMFLSQPTVSESIRSLENELGIKIFNRTNRGMELTADGVTFASYARTIVHNAGLMSNIGKQREYFEMCLQTPKITVIHDCFASFCEKHANSELIHASLKNSYFSPADAESALLSGECDIAIAISTPSLYAAAKKRMKENGITSDLLITLPLMLFSSVDHPVASIGFDPEKLNGYVCIHSSDPSEFTPFIQQEITAAISWDRVIQADNRETRLKLVAAGVGYEVGIPLPQSIMDKYRLKAIPIPNAEYSIISLCRSTRLNDANVNELYEMILNVYSNFVAPEE